MQNGQRLLSTEDYVPSAENVLRKTANDLARYARGPCGNPKATFPDLPDRN